jgi:hypothetical protein
MDKHSTDKLKCNFGIRSEVQWSFLYPHSACSSLLFFASLLIPVKYKIVNKDERLLMLPYWGNIFLLTKNVNYIAILLHYIYISFYEN